MINRITQVLKKYTDTEIIEPQSVLVNDLGLSSFDIVAIVTDMEDEFDIEIDDKDIRKLVTVNDLYKYIQEKLSN